MLKSNGWRLVSVGVVVSLASGFACTDDDEPTPIDATGVYTCTIETVDGYSSCGGPVYTSDLSGAAVDLTVSQVGSSVQIGAWGVVLTGTISVTGSLQFSRRDTECGNCSAARPFIIEGFATAAPRQLRDLSIRMRQELSVECEKTYVGTCAAN